MNTDGREPVLSMCVAIDSCGLAFDRPVYIHRQGKVVFLVLGF